MTNEEMNNIVPPQNTGAESNTENAHTFENLQQAQDFFAIAKHRLLHVNGWHHLTGKGTAAFQLTDAAGNDVHRTAQKDDHFKIDIPGPGPLTGEGYDWVQIEAIEEKSEGEEELVAMRVRPATNPHNERQDVAHFFSDEATSSFIVKRTGTTVCAEVHGRNEIPNTAAETIVDKARNAAVATGAVTGFSKLQWKSLVNGLLKRE